MKTKNAINRRAFVQKTVIGAASVALLGCQSEGNSSSESNHSADSTSAAVIDKTPSPILSDQIGLQLWTVKEDLAKDPIATLKAISKAGYKNIEVFGFKEGGFFGLPMQEFKNVLEGEGLKAVSGHYGLSRFTHWDANSKTFNKDYMSGLEASKTLGQEYTIVPWMNEDERKGDDAAKIHAEVLSYAAEEAHKMGLKFGYHNHAFEFEKYGDQTMYDIFLTETDSDKVNMEMDIYWVVYAGYDPSELIKKYPGRFPLYHVKDLSKSEEKESTEVGAGIIDFQRIFELNETAGIKHFIVEQEDFKNMNPLEAINEDYKKVKSLLS